MSETSTLIGYAGRKITREELSLVPIPLATDTHRPIPHHEIVQALVETLGFRHIGVVHDEYAVSADGMRMFGVLDLATEMTGCRFSIGLRNSHDKSMRLAMTCGYRVFVCSNMAFSGDFIPVLAKHSGCRPGPPRLRGGLVQGMNLRTRLHTHKPENEKMAEKILECVSLKSASLLHVSKGDQPAYSERDPPCIPGKSPRCVCYREP